ncbi:MAG TPA: dihydrofolate reductase family protein [Candidatus Saccharimonadales bacterium]|nr:dihydrofolate reductase family protein [Candidatus Saccharimonadales bacterium]
MSKNQHRGKVIIDMSMSLDGFIAGPGDTPDQPLGKGGEILHDWLGDPEAFSRAYGDVDEAPTAVIMGWRTYQNSLPYWNGKGPMGDTPCFVLTDKVPDEASDVFTFITEGGITNSLEQAQKVTNGRNIGLMGASIDQQFLKAGLVDTIRIHLIPVLLGDGISLFDHLGTLTKLEKLECLDAPEGTHLTYRVVNS